MTLNEPGGGDGSDGAVDEFWGDASFGVDWGRADENAPDVGEFLAKTRRPDEVVGEVGHH